MPYLCPQNNLVGRQVNIQTIILNNKRKNEESYFYLYIVPCPFIFTLCLACIGIGSLNAEEVNIPLIDLYSIMPMDDKEFDVIIVDDFGNNGFAASIDGYTLTVKVPAEKGNAQLIVTNMDNGTTAAVRPVLGTEERITLPAPGQYLLEIYTDTEAVGGVFRVE